MKWGVWKGQGSQLWKSEGRAGRLSTRQELRSPEQACGLKGKNQGKRREPQACRFQPGSTYFSHSKMGRSNWEDVNFPSVRVFDPKAGCPMEGTDIHIQSTLKLHLRHWTKGPLGSVPPVLTSHPASLHMPPLISAQRCLMPSWYFPSSLVSLL